VDIAKEYLSVFAKRLFEYRIPCLLWLITFSEEVEVVSRMLPLVPAFEKALGIIKPEGRTKLWDALDCARNELITAMYPDVPTASGPKKRFPNAQLRILVISDGHDVGSDHKDFEVYSKMREKDKLITVDSIILLSRELNNMESCKPLAAICHLTGGLAVFPGSPEEGLDWMGREVFLCSYQRDKGAFSKTRDEAGFEVAKRDAKYDYFVNGTCPVVSTETKKGLLKKELRDPKYVICQNERSFFEKVRDRRILEELHIAAVCAVEGMTVKNAADDDVSIYDPDLKIFAETENACWRCFVKPPEGTAYSGKWWYIRVTFPEQYPIRPPIFRFVSIPFHLNVAVDGRIFLSMIERRYVACTPVVALLRNIREMFRAVDLSTPVNKTRLELYRNNRREYERLALESTLSRIEPGSDMELSPSPKDTWNDWLGGCPPRECPDPSFVVSVNQGSLLAGGFNRHYAPGILHFQDDSLGYLIESHLPMTEARRKANNLLYDVLLS
jgi:ubiquitin-protein ligase